MSGGLNGSVSGCTCGRHDCKECMMRAGLGATTISPQTMLEGQLRRRIGMLERLLADKAREYRDLETSTSKIIKDLLNVGHRLGSTLSLYRFATLVLAIALGATLTWILA